MGRKLSVLVVCMLIVSSFVGIITILDGPLVEPAEAAVRTSVHIDPSEVSYPVVDTMQDLAFDTDSIITTPSEGEGFWGQDANYEGFQARYYDHGDGTITDNITGLMWQADPNGYDKAPWMEAMNNASNGNITTGGHSDWRVPTIKELYSLIDFRGEDCQWWEESGGTDTSELTPFIDTNYFGFKYGDTSKGEHVVQAQYWSSTQYVSTTMNNVHTVFGVNFADGTLKGYGTTLKGGTPNYSYVQYVRGGDNYGVNDLEDNGDGTITDWSTGLMWKQYDSGSGMNWSDALDHAESMTFAGYYDWRLPDAKELHSIVNYSVSPTTNGTPTIDPLFNCTKIKDEANNDTFPYYWTGTTLHNWTTGTNGSFAIYAAFGQAYGWMEKMPPGSGVYNLIDVHGAGALRADRKEGNPSNYPQGNGPFGEVIRIDNYVRVCRYIGAESLFKQGNGTIGNPYLIHNVWELQNMTLNKSAHYKIVNDIDATPTLTWNSGAGYDPVGSNSDPFTGSLNGEGYTIDGLFINRSTRDYVGIFGYVSGVGTDIHDIDLTNVNFTGDENVAGIAGYHSFGDIWNCTVDGIISSTDYEVGGVIGYKELGSIDNCINYATVSGEADVGGIVGESDADIIDCDNYGDIISTLSGHRVGGIAGNVEDYNITNCKNYGTVSNINMGNGGIVGLFQNGLIDRCINYGDVTGDDLTGGIVGEGDNLNICNSSNYGDLTGDRWVGGVAGRADDISNIWNCTNVGNFSGNEYVGGIAGRLQIGDMFDCINYGDGDSPQLLGGIAGRLDNASIWSCYNYGKMTGTASSIGGISGTVNNDVTVTNCHSYGDISGLSNVGGLIGENQGTVENCFATGDVGGVDNVGGFVGLHFSGSISNSSASGDINGLSDIGGFVGGSYGSIINSTSSGDASGTSYVAGFVGYVETIISIENCSSSGNATGSDYIGGFAGESDDAIFKYCSATGNAQASSSQAGGFIGYNGGDIYWCSATGTATGTGLADEIGGFAGINSDTIENSSATGDASGDDRIGGFVGDNSGVINNTYAWGEVTGDTSVGGFVGQNSGTISMSYSTRLVLGNTNVGGFCGDNSGTISANCFFDRDNSGTGSSDGGIATWNDDMMMQATFTAKGWDFTNVWMIREDETCPMFDLITYPTPTGSGTAGDPYVITNVYELQGMENDLNGVYIINNSFDASETEVWNGGVGFIPVGTSSSMFKGSLDGQGYTITGLNIYRPRSNDQGIFGTAGLSSSVFQNIHMDDFDIEANSQKAGLAGRISGGILRNCTFNGSIKGNSWRNAGIVGYFAGSEFVNCTNYGHIQGLRSTGGIVGTNTASVFNNHTNYGLINGQAQEVGGIAGSNSKGGQDCINWGNVTHNNDDVGGIFGYVSGGTIERCVNFGNVSTTRDEAGGIVGRIRNTASIYNCVNYGSVTADDEVGGIAGEENGQEIIDCINYGTISGDVYVGGIVGIQDDSDVFDSVNNGLIVANYGVGGITGYLDIGEISNCDNNGDVYYGNRLGGIAGIIIEGSIYNSNNFGDVSGDDYIGGVVGEANGEGLVNYSFNYGDITGDIYIGGVAAWSNMEINNSASIDATITGNSTYGGFVGRNFGSINRSFSTGSVVKGAGTGDTAGGFAGRNEWSIDNSFSKCSVTGSSTVGGFVGENIGRINTSYSIGAVTASSTFGGFCGDNTGGTIRNCFWDTVSSGQATSDGGTGQTTALMQKAATFITPGWNFTGIWSIFEDETYPFFGTYSTLGGSGTVGDPFKIKNVFDLQNMRNYLWANFTIVNSFDASESKFWYDGDGFEPVGTTSTPFTGSLNGQGFVVDGLYINRPSEDRVGLFGQINDQDSKLENLHLINAYIKGDDLIGLCGVFYEGTIFNSSIEGTILGDSLIGGMVGLFENGVLNNCTNSADIEGSDETGGLVGVGDYIDIFGCHNYGDVTNSDTSTGGIVANAYTVDIRNCTNYGTIKGDYKSGGIVGGNEVASIENCTNYGDVYGVEYTAGIIGNSEDIYLNYTQNYGEITATDEATGGITGYIDGFGSLKNPINHGNVTGTESVGGICGYVAESDIIDGYNYGNIDGEHHLGGIAGSSSEARLSNCVNEGLVTGTSIDVAGISGYFSDETMFNCINYGDVTSSFYVGGLVGHSNSATIEMCVNYGDVNCTLSRGAGIVGEAEGTTISKTTNHGDVFGGTDWGLGGFSGFLTLNSYIFNCTNYGNVSSGDDDVGGFVGRMQFSSQVKNCTNEGMISGNEYSGGIVGQSNTGVIQNCTNLGYIFSEHNTGGIIGGNDGTPISNCENYGIINGTGIYAGGINGIADGASVVNSSNHGNVTGDYSVGGISGFQQNTYYFGLINYGTIYATDFMVGGIVGGFAGEIHNCSNYGSVISDEDNAAGIVGYLGSNSMIENCSNHGEIYGAEDVGGIAGYASNSDLKHNSNYASVTGTEDYVGGIIGYFYRFSGSHWATNNQNFGTISGEEMIGGIIGMHRGGDLNFNINYGDVSGEDYLGGISGLHSMGGGNIHNSYNYGNISGVDQIGGICGYLNTGNLQRCVNYGDINSSGSNGGGIAGRSTRELKDNVNFGNVSGDSNIGGMTGYCNKDITNCTNWGDITCVSVNGAGIVGAYGSSRTVLDCTNNGNVTGTANAVGGIIGYFSTGSVINSHNYGYVYGNSSVAGIVGSGWTLTLANCTNHDDIYGTSYDVGGIIGYNYDSDVTNCTNLGSVDGEMNNVGGIIGENDRGSIVTSTNFGDVSGIDFVGGLAGISFDSNAIIEHSCSYGDVSGNNNTGSLVGNNTRTIKDCYAQGDVSGNDKVGGLVGGNQGTIDDAYSSGSVTGTTLTGGLCGENFGTITNCFWDTQTSGQAASDGGTGQTTTQMMTSTTFTGAGWDFTNVWAIENTRSYPYFDHLLEFYYPPQILTDSLPDATEDLFYNQTILFDITIVPSGIPQWSLRTNASGWLTLTDGVLSGTPGDNDVGTFWVEMTITDAFDATDTVNLTLIVLNTNDAPSITTLEQITTDEDVLYEVDYNATDVDASDSQTWALDTNAGWLSIDVMSGVLSGTPTNSEVGSYWVNVTVNDTVGAGDFQYFILTVENVNDDPIIDTVDVETATEDVEYSVDYEAHDIDPTGDTLTWSLHTEADWLDIDLNTGVLSGTPTNDDVGSVWANVTVSDEKGGSSFTNFSIEVSNANDGPVIDTDHVDTAYEDTLYSVTYSATDPDPTGDSLTWSMDSNAGWLGFDAGTRVLSGTPLNNDVGSYWVEIQVSDGLGGQTVENFTLTVENTNDPPSIVSTPVLNATELVKYTYNVTAIDDDLIHGDVLTFSFDSAPAGMNINGATGAITWTPTKDQVGEHIVIVNVTDGDEFHTQTFTINVIDVPEPNEDPIIDMDPSTMVVYDEMYIESLIATDLDGDTLTWSLRTNAGWLDIETGRIVGIPTQADIGTYWVELTVADGRGGTDILNFTVKVWDGITPTYDIDVGPLVYEDGEPADGIVMILDDGTEETTNDDGHVTFEGLEPGTYDVTIKAPVGDYFFTLTVNETGDADYTLPIIEKDPGSGSSSDLGTANIILIIVAILVLILVAIVALLFVRSRMSQDQEEASEPDEVEEEEEVEEDEEDMPKVEPIEVEVLDPEDEGWDDLPDEDMDEELQELTPEEEFEEELAELESIDEDGDEVWSTEEED